MPDKLQAIGILQGCQCGIGIRKAFVYKTAYIGSGSGDAGSIAGAIEYDSRIVFRSDLLQLISRGIIDVLDRAFIGNVICLGRSR